MSQVCSEVHLHCETVERRVLDTVFRCFTSCQKKKHQNEFSGMKFKEGNRSIDEGNLKTTAILVAGMLIFQHKLQTQQFYWSPTELGFMESAFFYGYAITQIPGGMLAAKFAPNL